MSEGAGNESITGELGIKTMRIVETLERDCVGTKGRLKTEIWGTSKYKGSKKLVLLLNLSIFLLHTLNHSLY